jgi:hypothetical protein
LILYGNIFGVEGARIFSEGLKVNTSLHVLDLGCNRIRNKGAVAIAQAIFSPDSNSNLEVLLLKSDFINEKGFKPFVSGILDKVGPLSHKGDLRLSALSIAGNQISLFEFQHLYKVLKQQNVPLFVDAFNRIKNNQDSCLFLSEVNRKTVNVDKVLNKI